MKYFFLLVLLSLNALACPGKKTLKSLYQEVNGEFAGELLSDTVNVDGKQIFRAWSENSCGSRGCLYLFALESQKDCFQSAGSFEGKVDAVGKNWNTIRLIQRNVAVEKIRIIEKKYRFNGTEYEEI